MFDCILKNVHENIFKCLTSMENKNIHEHIYIYFEKPIGTTVYETK